MTTIANIFSDDETPDPKAASVAAYFASARQGRTRWWAWILGFLFIITLSFGGMMAIGAGTAWVIPDTPTGNYILTLLTFLPVFVAVPLIYKLWHKLPINSLMTSASHFRWGHFWRTLFIMFTFLGVFSFGKFLLRPGEFEGLQVQTDISVYFRLLLMTLIFVPFQAASEEFLCRGYLSQALIKYLRSPWLVFVITSGGFALLHVANPETTKQIWPYLVGIFLFGMAMCVLVYYEGGIESAIGAHIANNIFVFTLLGYEDPFIPNTAIYTLQEPIFDWIDFGIDCFIIILPIALIIWANRKWGRSV